MAKSTLAQEPNARELREQIQQTVREATQAARAAAQEARNDIQAERGVIVAPAPPAAPGTPGVMIRQFPDEIPPQVETISIAFFVMLAAVIIGYPIMRAIGRRIERGAPVAAPLPPEVRDQLQHISQSVEAIAIEVERISEGQRFAAKLLADRAGEPAKHAASRD